MRSPTFCVYKPNTNSASLGRFLEADGFRLVTILENESQARLAWVKAKTLSRIRSGYGSVNRVKTFSLSGSDRVSRVKLG
jgi:hypothetical protein